jgi:2-hydroxychromene-2-carboxylate isomerase
MMSFPSSEEIYDRIVTLTPLSTGVGSRKEIASRKLKMSNIDYFFATLSPYAYLAGGRLEEIAAKHGATITYKPLDIIALFNRTGGTSPKDRHFSRQEYRSQELLRQSKHLGMPFNLKPAHWPTNPAPSSYAIIAAQNAGGGDVGKLVQGYLHACWAEEKDLADDGVVRAGLEAAGFDPELANSGLLTGAETYAANLEEAVERGVFGAPFYITEDDQRYWGQDRLSYLDEHLAG